MPSANAPLAVFAHPGHELRLLYSLRELKARCLYLTDASASTGQARLHLTDRTLEQAGIPPRLDFPVRPDGDYYAAIRSGQAGIVDNAIAGIEAAIKALKPAFLITDSAEGYNPVHDLCHFMVKSAAARHGVPVFDVALDGDPGTTGGYERTACHVFRLGAADLAAKLTLIGEYAEAAGPQLSGEARALLRKYGDDSQGLEILRPARDWPSYDQDCRTDMPFFEAHGRRRVAEGKYATALTYRGHLQPLLARLQVMA
jgi:hypothetical protein